MAINYQSQNPSKNFIMVDRGIDDLSADAFYLLIEFMKLAPNDEKVLISLSFLPFVIVMDSLIEH